MALRSLCVLALVFAGIAWLTAGQVINPRFLMLSYPSRWFYDILRALDYFRGVGASFDPRMQDALDVLLQKTPQGRYLAAAGQTRG